MILKLLASLPSPFSKLRLMPHVKMQHKNARIKYLNEQNLRYYNPRKTHHHQSILLSHEDYPIIMNK